MGVQVVTLRKGDVFRFEPGRSILNGGGLAIVRQVGDKLYGFESVDDALGHETTVVFSGSQGQGVSRKNSS